MKKRSISSSSYRFIKNEAAYLEREAIIDGETRMRIVEAYEPREQGMNYIRVILAIGSILVGLGIISFIASNWGQIGNGLKMTILIAGFLAFALGGRKMEEKYPRTGRSFTYISVLIFGAAIFLIEQMYNISIHFSKSFLLWSLGVLPMAYILRDKLIFFLAHALLLIHSFGNFDYQGIAWDFAVLLLIFYVLNKIAFETKAYFLFIQNAMAAIWLVDTIHELGGSNLLSAGIIFGIGVIMKYVLSKRHVILGLEGNLFLGFSGFALTFKNIWNDIPLEYAGEIAIIFGIGLMAYFLLDTRKGYLSSLFFVCILIFRYYVDNFYDFMPKSMFFIMGGLILIAFGYFFERMRRKEAEGNEKRS